MSKFEYRTLGRFEDILMLLDDAVMHSALSMRLVDSSDISCKNAHVAVRVYDKYFMRNDNRASLTLTVVASEGEVCISAIGAGGGSGAIFNFSWGAEDNLVNVVKDAVRDNML